MNGQENDAASRDLLAGCAATKVFANVVTGKLDEVTMQAVGSFDEHEYN